jgi:hypothetical protein
MRELTLLGYIVLPALLVTIAPRKILVELFEPSTGEGGVDTLNKGSIAMEIWVVKDGVCSAHWQAVGRRVDDKVYVDLLINLDNILILY